MDDKNNKSQKEPPIQKSNLIWWILAGFLAIAVLQGQGLFQPTGNSVSYTTFQKQLKQGNISSVTLQGQEIQAELKKSAPEGSNLPKGAKKLRTFAPNFGQDELMSQLQTANVDIDVQPPSDNSWWLIVGNLLPFLLIFFIGILIFRQIQSRGQGLFSMGKSQAKLFDQNRPNVTFDDVAGAEEGKNELKEIVELLKSPKKFHDLGARTPKGLLLVGAPGTGKTLLARAVAGEAGVPFFSISGSDFMQMFVGVGASRVRDMFRQARDKAPAIIFIDELDSIGRQRGTGLGGGHDEREQTLNQLLSELDGFEPTENIIVMGATNRPDVLDPALLRPGRFDRKVTINPPSQSERLAILRVHAKNKTLDKDVELETVARRMRGASGAELEEVLNEAAMIAARANKEKIDQSDLEAAQDKVLLGLQRKGVSVSEEELGLLAFHEAGHALLSLTLPNADPLQKISIMPRSKSLGLTQQSPEREMYIYPQDYLKDRLCVMMGGRAAEKLIFNRLTTGAASDLKEATKLSRKMVMEWGMNSTLGPFSPETRDDGVFLGKELAHQGRDYSDKTAREVDEDVKSILNEAFERATSKLKENQKSLYRLAEELKQKEEMTGDEVRRLLQGLLDSKPSPQAL